MPYHINEDLEYLSETLKINVVNPATSQLFTITDEAKELEYKKNENNTQ